MRFDGKVQSLMLGLIMRIAPAASSAAIDISVTIRPPALPVDVQPPCPTEGYHWIPGYWGFGGGNYIWHEGYWGPHVGFYGGVNYGFGYAGVGFNGPGGIQARPNAFEQTAEREQHFNATPNQLAHIQSAGRDRTQFASVNNGRPATAAMDSVNGRRFNQQQRIAQGVSTGQLTPRETARVENKEANINHQLATDRAANGGKLTPQERQQRNLQREAQRKARAVIKGAVSGIMWRTHSCVPRRDSSRRLRYKMTETAPYTGTNYLHHSGV